jgi:hypothetical protein
MAFSICYIQNISGDTKTLNGKVFDDEEMYLIEDMNRISWATNDSVLVAISNAEMKIHNSLGVIESVSDQIDWLKDY